MTINQNQSNLYQTNGQIETLANIYNKYKMYVNNTEQSLYDGDIEYDNYKIYVNHTAKFAT